MTTPSDRNEGSRPCRRPGAADDNVPVIVEAEVVSSYGTGLKSLWGGLMSGTAAIGKFDRFPTGQFSTRVAAIVPGLKARKERSLVNQMLTGLFNLPDVSIPEDACLYAASTVGEIDCLVQEVTDTLPASGASTPGHFLDSIAGITGITGNRMMISAACASSTSAIAMAAAAIRNGETDCALVVAADAVTEFVFAGFAALMALDPKGARPFDREREGLSLGEAAGYILIMSRKRALQEQRGYLAGISGWGMSNDANHLTGPSRSGEGLSRAIRIALGKADVVPGDVDGICAHGTGTVYNDAMEMRSFQDVFSNRRLPVFSIKGGIGHTLAAAGLVEVAVIIKALEAGALPGTIGLTSPDPLAEGFVSPQKAVLKADTILTTNSGFGGINAALVIRKAKV